MEHEGYDWAPFFNSRGIACIVLKYRMPFGNRNVPFGDAQEALRLIHEHAAEWHLNPYDIGIMGSSAGGHLASTMAVSAPYGIRPAFQILFYPVISMERGKTHRGSLEALLGKDASDDLQRRFSNERNVRRHIVPPAILLLSNDDTGRASGQFHGLLRVFAEEWDLCRDACLSYGRTRVGVPHFVCPPRPDAGRPVGVAGIVESPCDRCGKGGLCGEQHHRRSRYTIQ